MNSAPTTTIAAKARRWSWHEDGRATRQCARARFWQHGGGFDRAQRDMDEFVRTVKYIHRNPVERGLVTRPEDWRWSSLRWWMGRREGEAECDPPPGLPGMWERSGFALSDRATTIPGL